MGPDYFSVLGQQRRPWLDLERLKQEYQRLTFARHPDRTDGVDEGSDFGEINEAFRVLSNPKLRLQHLLSLETQISQPTAVPAEISDAFMDTASLVNEIDRLLQRRDAATSALAKSVILPEVTALQDRARAALEKLHELQDDALDDLQRLDEYWTAGHAEAASQLGKLAHRFGYLDRWIGQLREKQFRLANE